MFCPHCGNQLPDGAGFCGNCGNRLTAKPKKAEKTVAYGPLLTIIGFCLLIAVLYAGITTTFFLLPSAEAGLEIESLYHGDTVSDMTFGSFLTLLTEGNRIFHPTVLSTALGNCLQVLYWLIPFFGALALAGAIFDKNSKRLCTVTSVLIGFTALMTVAIVPLSLWLIPGLQQALALQAGLLHSDLGGVTILQPIITAVVALVLMAGTIIATVVFHNWRAKR